MRRRLRAASGPPAALRPTARRTRHPVGQADTEPYSSVCTHCAANARGGERSRGARLPGYVTARCALRPGGGPKRSSETQDRLDGVALLVDAELVRHREEQGVGRVDRSVLL